MLAQAYRLHLQFKSEQALSLASEIVMHYPKCAEAYDLRSDLNRELGNMTAAIADIDQAIALAPNTLQYVKNRANINDINGHLKEAIADYGYVLVKEPKDCTVWRDRAKAYKRLKKYGQAAADFEKAVLYGQDNHRLNDFMYERAQMHLLDGNLGRALEASNELIKRFPYMSKGHWIRAQVYDKLAKPDLAAKERSKATAIDENLDPATKE